MKGLRLLIVDHDVAFVDHIITQLKRQSILVSWVTKSKDVLIRIESLLPDVVILNANMPDMDAVKTLQKIKTQYPLIEVIMLTENSSVKAAILGMQKGAVDYLKKPISANEMIKKIKHAYQKVLKHREKINRFKKFLT